MSASPVGLKRARSEVEPDSQEIPEKRTAIDPLLKPSSLEEKTPKPEQKNGFFKKSELKTTDDYQKTLQKLEEQQKDKKKPIVFPENNEDYYPERSTSENKTETEDISSMKPRVSFGVFGSQKKLGNKENDEDKDTSHQKCSDTNSKEPSTDGEKDNKQTFGKSNPFAKALEKSSGFGSGTGFGGGFSSGSGFGSGKKENGTEGKSGFSRFAGVTGKSWSSTAEAESQKQEEVKTGEEDEKNVLEVTTAKLFKFDRKTQSYSERGRGILRMNDKGEGSDFSSRLVFRTAGTQRVALNTKIWTGMSVEQCTPKSIRISAQDTSSEDDTDVGVFLIQCAVEQSKQLFSALDYRILQIKQKEENEK